MIEQARESFETLPDHPLAPVMCPLCEERPAALFVVDCKEHEPDDYFRICLRCHHRLFPLGRTGRIKTERVAP